MDGLYSETNLEEASRIADLKQRGWLPEWFPAKVRSGMEGHHVDASRVIVTFVALEDTTTTLLSGALPVSNRNVALPPKYLAKRNWWPFEDLKREIPNGKWQLRQRVDKTTTWTITASPDGRILMWNM